MQPIDYYEDNNFVISKIDDSDTENLNISVNNRGNF